MTLRGSDVGDTPEHLPLAACHQHECVRGTVAHIAQFV